MDFGTELSISGAVESGALSPVKTNLSKVHEDALEYFQRAELSLDEDIIAFDIWMQENNEG